ncbi:alpha-D-ribose 1-methylphosphonate 5-triphosphate diphosphatase [Pseudooceanicola nitratireducens]|jgi:alpha-D-ribose 1-methylphosphonate 5-triphosphate diphosphatase|uniref:alpha-D-ribose 1-methylphosphonate 5-triphosphate diphosphatase n=1 Tax=Pseudooceanicola nitratireducens TaxID=517719 RepID=UPI001C94DE01|nr:alpha-D-ribose 1-methylphosphonate 5-triphosphate diphosphatase [Pseudooceanicola nitratireducens]MBY6165581.1 alpha-D-ribose 1-methylphosphonate 5-triphosphate diphosphatase [Pseudooceanicola nitratireducens]
MKDISQQDEVILSNAKLILPGEVIDGHVVMRNGKVAEVGTGPASGGVDCDGDWVAPGLVELHTDNLERHMQPRPKVNWPHQAAIVAHDRELAGCGITTVFDAIRVGSIVSDANKRYGKYARSMADEILSMQSKGALRISHRLHLRAETCSETLLEELEEFGPEDRVGIVSLMDHTPGQRQFRDIGKFEDYVCGKHGLSKEGFADYCDFLTGLHDKLGTAHEAGSVAAAARFGAVLASHDDTTADQVAVSAGHGIRMAEFPTTVEAARACHAHNIKVIMGAPNLVRGGSHSGNVAASELADLDLLDILSSDYVPAALLLAAVQLGELWGDMARGIATVTSAPARASGLADRGMLEPGQRADLIRFSMIAGVPAVRGVWVQGDRVA